MRIYIIESAPVYEYVQSTITIGNKVLLISVEYQYRAHYQEKSVPFVGFTSPCWILGMAGL
jgi:hypothetical protein